MQLKQLNLNYIPTEDRLVMRINTHDKAELSFWLTRAVVIQMLHGLLQAESQLMLSSAPAAAQAAALNAVLEFRKEAAVAEADFQSEFASDAASYPLGETPQLVVKCVMTCHDDHADMSIQLASNQVIGINLNAQLAVSINKLLHDVVSKIDWHLPLQEALPVAVMPAVSTTLH